MKASTTRILTTHAGRLDGPPEFRALGRSLFAGAPLDMAALQAAVRPAMVDVVRRQAAAGIDVTL